MVAVPHQQRKRLRSDGSSLAQCVIHLLVLRLFITADAQYSDCQRHFFSRGDDTHRHEFDVASFRSSLTGSTTSNRDSFDKSHLHRLEVELRRDGNHAVNISEKQGVRFCRRIYQALSLDLGIHQEALNSCKQQVYGLKHDDENRGDNDEVWFAGVVVPRLLPRSGRHDVAFENLPDPLRRVYSELHQQHLPITTTTAASEDSSLAEEDFCRRLLVADALQEQQDQQGQQQEMATADATSSDAPRDALLLQPRKAPREIAVPAPSPSSADVLTPSVVARTTSRYAPSSAAHHHHHHRSLMDDTPMPTINNQELTLCMDDLFTSDRECCPRDKRISQAEFIFVLNSRFALNLPENYPFASLHALYQQAYNEASAPGGEGPDISATIPGVSITAAQRQYLVQVCSILEAAHLEVLAQSPSAAPVPTASPNNNASPQPTSPATFRNKCNVAVLLNEDNDGLFGINVLEYVQVIRAVTGNASLGTSPQDGLVSFDALPAPLQAPFASYGTTTLPIAGAPGQRSPALNLFCDKVHFAVDRYQNPQPTVAPTPAPVPEDPCFARLVQADADQSNSLSPTEYLAYVGTIGGTWSGSPLDAVPFIVQKNYAWIRGVDAELDLTAATATTTPSLPTQRTLLTAACHRTKTIVEAAVAGNNGVELQEHCFAALTRADDNVDDDLNQDEFVQAVNFFIGLGYSPSFNGLDPEFRALFNANKGGSNNAIGIDGSKPNQTPSQIEQLSLDFLCGKLDETLTAVQTTNVLLEKCRLSLGHATNTTTDGPSFSEADFVVFMHTLADVAVAANGNAQFSDLGADIQAFFPTFVEALRAIDVTVWVGGGGPLADDQRTTMFNACTQAIELSGEVPPPPPPNQVTTIFSSFQIASRSNQSLTNASADFGNLAAAYTALVQAETTELAAAAATRRRRYLRSSSQRQLLVVVGVAEGSAQLYQLDDDLACPPQQAEAGSTCQTVYGRFDLLYRNEDNDVPALENQVTTQVQQAIADGALQSALDAIHPTSPVTILGPGTRTIPLDPTAPTPAPVGTDDDDDFAGVGVPAFIGILAGVGFACCCLGGLFLCLYMSKQSGLGNSSSKSSVGKSSSFPGSTIYQLEDETITSRHRNSVDEDLSSFRDEPDVVEQAPAHHKKKRSKKRNKSGSGKRPEQQPPQRSKKAPQSKKKKSNNTNNNKHTFDDEYSQDSSSSSKGSSVNSSSDHSRSELEPALGADPLGGSYGLGPDDTGLGLYNDEPAAESDYGGSAGSSDHEFGLYKEPADAESEHDVVYKNAVVVDDWGRSSRNSNNNRPPPPPPPPPTDTTWGTQTTNWGNGMNRQQQQQQPKSPRSPASNHSRGGTAQQQQPTINSFFESDTGGGNGTYGRASTTRSVGSGTTPTKASGGSSGGSRGGGTASWGSSGSPSRSSAVAPPPDAPFGDDRAEDDDEDDDDEFSATSRHETDDEEEGSSSGSESAGRKVKPPRAAQRKYGYEYEDGDDDLEPEDEEDDDDDEEDEGEQDEESDEEDEEGEEEEGSSEEDDEESGSSSEEEDDTDDGDTWTSAERQKYRETIEALVQEVVPDEIEHVDAMMEQFVGREEELINTLRSMTTSASEDESEAETSDDEEDDEEEEEEEESSGEEESDEEEEESDEEESEEERTAASGDHTAGGKSYSFGSDSDDSSSGSGSSEYDEETVSS